MTTQSRQGNGAAAAAAATVVTDIPRGLEALSGALFQSAF